MGIFWLVKGTLILKGVLLGEAEAGGRYLNAPGHEGYWNQLRRRRAVPPEMDYDEPPRKHVCHEPLGQETR